MLGIHIESGQVKGDFFLQGLVFLEAVLVKPNVVMKVLGAHFGDRGVLDVLIEVIAHVTVIDHPRVTVRVKVRVLDLRPEMSPPISLNSLSS